MLALYLTTSGLLLFNGILIIVRAYINERTGATFLTICSLLGIGIFSYDIFAYEGIFAFNSVVFSACYIVMFGLMTFALLFHLGIIKGSKARSNTLTFGDLYGNKKE
jgi:hypothetical protein